MPSSKKFNNVKKYIKQRLNETVEEFLSELNEAVEDSLPEKVERIKEAGGRLLKAFKGVGLNEQIVKITQKLLEKNTFVEEEIKSDSESDSSKDLSSSDECGQEQKENDVLKIELPNKDLIDAKCTQGFREYIYRN